MTRERCSLCGDKAHDEPDTEGWMGLLCPGAQATEEQAEAFRSQLARAFAEHITAEFDVLNTEIAERRRLWYERTRNEVTPAALQADCDVRTDDELDRQRREDLIVPFGEFELPAHLTVPGEVPQRPPILRTGRDVAEPEDSLLFVQDEEG